MRDEGLPRIGLIWSQFAPYHVDRCESAAHALAGRATLIACEVATASRTYAWSPSGDVAGARKVTLFPGQVLEEVSLLKLVVSSWKALRGCRVVFVGVSYAEAYIVLLGLLLRISGCRLVLMNDSKFDDKPRSLSLELTKSLVLSIYDSAIAGGERHRQYLRFLGFRRRRIELGYDTVNLDRVRTMGGGVAAPDGKPYVERRFTFVGRFVTKKNILQIIDAYRIYLDMRPVTLHGLVLVGGGELEPEVRDRIAAHGLFDHVEITGFLQSDGVAEHLAGAVALLLPSTEEQWGLVVNEALAFNLPAIVSENVGSRDLLVRSGINGFVIETGNVQGLATAMAQVSAGEDRWRSLCAQSCKMGAAAHSDRFGEAVSVLSASVFAKVNSTR